MKRVNMKTNKIFARKEKGQVIVLLVIIALTAIAFIALLVDGGMLMINKRQAQAAADAGALAGAKTLCRNASLEDLALAESDAQGAAIEYVEGNSGALLAFDISYADYRLGGVSVTASVSRPAVFASLIGVPTITSNAEATAACLVPKNHIIPIAWYCEGSVETDCGVEILDWDNPDGPLPSPTKLYLLLDPNLDPDNPWSWCTDFSDPLGTINGMMICGNTGAFPSDATFQALGNGSRAWISSLCGSGAIGQCILNGSATLAIEDLDETPGVKSSVYKPAIWPGLPQIYLVPFYDSINSYPSGRSGGNFHLGGVSAFVVTCVNDKADAKSWAAIDNVPCPGARAWMRENFNAWVASGGAENQFWGLMGSIEGYFIHPINVDMSDPGNIDALSLGVHYISLVH